MSAVERGIAMLGTDGAGWLGLAAAGWLVAGLTALVAVWQAARADRLGLQAAEAAHELRGPLCAARLALGSLDRALSDAPHLVRGIAAIDLELRRAGLALQELGSVGSTVERRGALPSRPCPAPVDLRALATAAEPAWQALAAAHETTLTLRIGDGQLLAAGDEREIARGIGNLVGNACEHGRGPVIVSVTGDASGALVEVCDEGGGPAADVVRRARRRASTPWMARSDASLRGHGMAVAARAARASGGRLRADATPAGAVVALELPSSVRIGCPPRPRRVRLIRHMGRASRRTGAETARSPLAWTR